MYQISVNIMSVQSSGSILTEVGRFHHYSSNILNWIRKGIPKWQSPFLDSFSGLNCLFNSWQSLISFLNTGKICKYFP